MNVPNACENVKIVIKGHALVRRLKCAVGARAGRGARHIKGWKSGNIHDTHLWTCTHSVQRTLLLGFLHGCRRTRRNVFFIDRVFACMALSAGKLSGGEREEGRGEGREE